MTAYIFQQKALMRLLTALFASAGIVPGGDAVARLPRTARNEIVRVLLPLESAVRRLIFYRSERISDPNEDPGEKDTSKTKSKRRGASGSRKGGTRAPVFWLFDKLRWFPGVGDPRRRPRRGPGPRILSFDEPYPQRELIKEKAVRDPDCALKICRRLQAVMRALSDIDGHALRLKRIIAKREADPKPKQVLPMRPGPPPGHRWNKTHEVDRLLYESDHLANEPVPPEVGERVALKSNRKPP